MTVHRSSAPAFFSRTYDEALAMLRETRDYLTGRGKLELRALPREAALDYSRESMRLTARLTQVMAWLLLQRAVHLDPATVIAAAAAAPDDVAAQTAAADVEVLSEQIQPAIDRLIGFVKRSAGDERSIARTHLLELFSVLDPEDERIVTGRRALSNALY